MHHTSSIVDKTLVLRATLAIILLMHGVPSIVSGDVNAFGTAYLDPQGFAPFGLYLAWAIKLSHLASAVLLIVNRYIVPVSLLTMVILVGGIIMVHLPEGWFVVGGGRNGIEFNVLLISVFLYLTLLQKGHSTRV